MSSLSDLVGRSFGEEAFGSGVQFAAYRHGEVEELALGSADPTSELTSMHSFNLYCGSKPLEAISLLAGLEGDGIPCGRDVPLAVLLGRPDLDSRQTLGSLLCHESGHRKPDLFEFMNSSRVNRAALLPTPESLLGTSPAPSYSPVLLSWALDRIARGLLACPLEEVVERTTSSLSMGSTFVTSDRPRSVATYVDSSGTHPLPLLHDSLPAYVRSPHNVLTGFYTSAIDLCRWAIAIVESLRGQAGGSVVPSGRLLAEHLAPGLAGSSDLYAGSFAVLRRHGLPSSSACAFGGFGFVRSSLLYVDPENETVMVGIVRELRLEDLDRRLAQWDAAVALLLDGV